MSNSSQTVQTLVTQVTLMREELDRTRALITEVLAQMLRIAQTQADTTRELTAAFTTMVQATQLPDGTTGSTRVLSEEGEWREWRDSLEKARRG